MKTEVLGTNEWQSGWRVECVPNLQGVLNLSRDLLKLAEMIPDGPPDVRHYPTESGGGGVGIQVYQPLVESWLVVSTWPEHGFTRVNLSSCKQFDHQRVTDYLNQTGRILMVWHNLL